MNITIKNIVAALLLMSGAAIMLSLGFWQVERLKWKNDIIDQLNDEYSKPSNELLISINEIDNSDKNILYGSVRGYFLNNKSILFGPKTYDGKIGFYVITPFKTKSGTILVNQGWVDAHDVDLLPQKTNNKLVTVTGIIRKPDWNNFTPNNNPVQNIWTKLDINQIAKTKDIKNISNRIIYLSDISINSDHIKIINKKWYPRNKHKQYAIFWFSMAFIFLGFFVFYARQQKLKKL